MIYQARKYNERKNMKKIILFTLILGWMICCSRVAYASEGEAESAFRQANAHYESGNYNKAIASGEAILATGLRSGNLYYNLANAYFKKGDLGKAILYYERARRYMPRDGDLVSNYKYARSKLKQRGAFERRSEFLKRLDRIARRLTLKESILMGGGAYYLFTLLVILAIAFKKLRGLSVLFALMFMFIFLSIAIPFPREVREYKNASIVVDKITDARFEPVSDAEVHFPVYEGMKLYILREWGDWCKVKRPDGKIGWVPVSAVEIVGM